MLTCYSCSDSFLNHSMKAEPIGNCNNEPLAIGVESNINGQRFTFNACLDENFTGKEYTILQKGDSILLNFQRKGKSQKLFQVHLDIDAKPAFSHLVIDGQNFSTIRIE